MNFNTIFSILATTMFTFSSIALGSIKVISTTPDIDWLVKKIGQDKVISESLLDGTEDPHFVDAMPHFVSRVSNADVFCFVGLDLEVAWAPKIINKSANTKVQKGGKGYCDAGSSVKAIDIPSGRIDRSMGDVHSSGNPHYHLSPTSYLEAASTILEVLNNSDPNNSEHYLKNFDILSKELNGIKNQISKILNPLSGLKIMQYHKEFSYFINEFGLKESGSIEKVPGVPPSAGRLARVVIESKSNKVSLVVSSETSPQKTLEKFSAMSGIPTVSLPISIKKNKFPKDYKELLLGIASKIKETAELGRL